MNRQDLRTKATLVLAGVLAGLLISALWYYAPGRIMPECARHHAEVPRYCVD